MSTEEDEGGFLDFECFPSKMRKAPNKEGRLHRNRIGCFLIFNIFFVIVALWQAMGVGTIIMQCFYLYLNYYIYMTLSRVGTFLYLLIVAVGTVYAIFGMFSLSTANMFAYLIYCFMQFM